MFAAIQIQNVIKIQTANKHKLQRFLKFKTNWVLPRNKNLLFEIH